MFIVSRLAALAATIVIAPAVSFVVFDMLSKEYFDPGETFSALWEWERAFLLHFDIGYNTYYDASVTWVLVQGIPADVTMLLGGLTFGLVAGVTGGLYAVAHPRTALRRVLDFFAGLGVSMPVYWMGFAILMLFASNTGMIAMLPFVSGAAQYKTLPSIRSRSSSRCGCRASWSARRSPRASTG